MKNLMLHILLLISFTVFSQERVENPLIQKTELDLLGYWEKLPGNHVEKKYYVEEQNGQLFLNIGEFQKGGLEFKVSDKILIEIVQEKTIKLKNFILENNGISELILLDSEKLILKNGSELLEFKKLK